MPQVRLNGSSNGVNGKSQHLFVEGHVPALTAIAMPPPPMSKAEIAASFWIGTFYRYHGEEPYVPVRLKMVDCPQRGDDGKAVINGRGKPERVRYLWEVARRQQGRRAQWFFILWGVDDQSLRIKRCASRREALAHYEQPPNMVLSLKAPGVRLRWEAVQAVVQRQVQR